MPGNKDLALVKLLNAGNGTQRRRLACAVVADEAVDLARGDVQSQIIHGELIAESLGKMFNFQHNDSPVLIS